MNPRIVGLRFFILLFAFSGFFPVLKSVSNKELSIAKAFHHLGTLQDKIIFYLKENPTLTLLSRSEKPQDQLEYEEVYLLENAKISKEAKPKIDEINNFKHPFYRFKIAPVRDGIKIIINYNPEFIEKIEPLFFDAISLFKSLMFYIVHKDATKHLDMPKTVVKNKELIVIIDPGHGQTDPGGVGLYNVAEKDIVLTTGLKLKKALEKKKINVFLTRDRDVFVALDDRTKFANFLPSNSIFISLHANLSVNSKAEGLETYYADYSLLKNHKDNSSFSDDYGFEISKKNKQLACIIHENIYNAAKKFDSAFKDRKVRKSVSQILIGTQMPSILIELGYLSNEDDNKRLQSLKFQDAIVSGLVNGIEKYNC
ncbi:MAG: N-acetylmuramoyl-L-alanine amidase [Candidatus Babeliales bacterium]|nr:N-acetylmuramoyl-L-alanine amidase [Candidatus Babeliales bacterium]